MREFLSCSRDNTTHISYSLRHTSMVLSVSLNLLQTSLSNKVLDTQISVLTHLGLKIQCGKDASIPFKVPLPLITFKVSDHQTENVVRQR